VWGVLGFELVFMFQEYQVLFVFDEYGCVFGVFELVLCLTLGVVYYIILYLISYILYSSLLLI